jgi:hypothetical protein
VASGRGGDGRVLMLYRNYPRLDRTLLLAQDEADHWLLAGAKGFRGLVAGSRGV